MSMIPHLPNCCPIGREEGSVKYDAKSALWGIYVGAT